ncbi:MAG: hypothetical protein ACTSQG_02770 [Promethearchaeota archaeon]
MKNYNRDLILDKLKKRRIKEVNGTLIIPAYAQIGIKMWGMIDFLKMPYQIKQSNPKVKSWEIKKPEPKGIRIKEIGNCKVCGKIVTNQNGLIRFYKDSKIILHKGICRKKHDWMLNNRLLEIKKEVK